MCNPRYNKKISRPLLYESFYLQGISIGEEGERSAVNFLLGKSVDQKCMSENSTLGLDVPNAHDAPPHTRVYHEMSEPVCKIKSSP